MRFTDGQTEGRTDIILTTRLPCIQCSVVKIKERLLVNIGVVTGWNGCRCTSRV